MKHWPLIAGIAVFFLLGAFRFPSWSGFSVRIATFFEVLRAVFSFRTNIFQKIQVLIRFIRLCWCDTPIGDAMGVPEEVRKAWMTRVHASAQPDPDKILEELAQPVRNPMIAFHEALMESDHSKLAEDNPFKGQKITVSDATVFEAHFDERGRMVRDRKVLESLNGGLPTASRLRRAHSTEEYKALVEKSHSAHERQQKKAKAVRESRVARLRAGKRMVEDGLCDWGFMVGQWNNFDPNQYTEFAPTMGGPFFKNLHLHDMLKAFAYAFEAKNHNPVAKRVVDLLSDYCFGRRFKVRIKDARKEKIWNDYDKRYHIRENLSAFWCPMGVRNGEFMLDLEKFDAIDPSTVWDIVTDVDNCNDPYYYFQSYPTDYQMYTGYRVSGEPGAEKQKASDYIVRQIPAHKVLHIKFNCDTNEKRGRSFLYPILGWLKRIKDIYNSQAIREWLLSNFVWDVTIKGNEADAAAYANQYSQMPNPGSIEVHNESVTRKPMPAIEGSGTRGQSSVSANILAFIALVIGAPKEFFNVQSVGGGSRATALTSAEPFTKVIEGHQARWEYFLTELFKHIMTLEGLDYSDGDVEFLFPSVTKDTTTETVTNLGTGESMGWISKQTAAEMFAGEMGITNYDFETEQKRIKSEASKGMNQMGATPMPPGGRYGKPAPGDTGSEIHGDGKVELEDELTSL